MSKVATTPKTFTAIQSYDQYSKTLIVENTKLRGERAYKLKYGKVYNEDGTLYIDYHLYKKILSLYFIKAGVKMIEGFNLNLEHGLGYLYIMRQERNPASKPRLNKGESFRLKKQLEEKGGIEGDNWKVYYTDDEFTRTNWFKPYSDFIRNIEFYKFAPAGGQAGKGFKQLMSRTISSNPNLVINYPFVPYKYKPKEKNGL